MVSSLVVRPAEAGDGGWVRVALQDAWGSVTVARRGELVDASTWPGFVAVLDGERVGLAVVAARGPEYEVIAIATSIPRRGVGRALLQQCFADARSRGCHRVWLTTTNDNVPAFAFYQRLGMDLCAFYRDGVTASRRLKPTIPLRNHVGILIAHELEFELLLDPA
jgi:ribosomal protein S18 acetylase RimI-like enzyme